MPAESERRSATGSVRCERYLVAVHEAGHAVMSFQLELGVEEVSILPSGDRLGVCRNAGRAEWEELLAKLAAGTAELDLPRRLLIDKHIQVSLAGPEAERLVRGAYNVEGAAGDEAAIRLLLGLLGWPASWDLADFLQRQRRRAARRLTRAPVWQAVEAVARGLLKHGRLTGDEAAALHDRATGRSAWLAERGAPVGDYLRGDRHTPQQGEVPSCLGGVLSQ